jgi:hypothetical protein
MENTTELNSSVFINGAIDPVDELLTGVASESLWLYLASESTI